jgi:hypothetical protein
MLEIYFTSSLSTETAETMDTVEKFRGTETALFTF